LIKEVGLKELNPVPYVCEVLVCLANPAANDAEYLVVSLQQDVRQKRAVLATDSGNERPLHPGKYVSFKAL